MTSLVLNDISVTYPGQEEPAVVGASVRVDRGDFVVLVGRSGCGKTTLLNVAGGFLQASRGRATVGDRPIEAPGADRAVVFQNDALFPWLTARENVAFALRMRGVQKTVRSVAAEFLLAKVKLAGYGDKPVWQLSGGMRQRVGLARALAAAPAFLLMDEPLGALDALTRERMQTLLLDLWAEDDAGFLMVTHGIEEALLLATTVVVMAPRPGRIVRQVATPFGRRYASGEPLRSIKSDPAFTAARAEVTDAIFAGETV